MSLIPLQRISYYKWVVGCWRADCDRRDSTRRYPDGSFGSLLYHDSIQSLLTIEEPLRFVNRFCCRCISRLQSPRARHGDQRVPCTAGWPRCAVQYALKPSIGSVRMDGDWCLSPEFDTVGAMAKSVVDLATVTEILLSTTRQSPPERELSPFLTKSF